MSLQQGQVAILANDSQPTDLIVANASVSGSHI
jgi:hypothetical protein